MVSDQIFVDGIQQGDEKIIKMFYKKNYWVIRTYITKNSGNSQDVEDVFQDALILVYQKLRAKSLRIDTSIHAYFYGVCKNLWRNKLRRKKKVVFTDTYKEYQHFEESKIITEITYNDQEQLFHKYFFRLNDSSKQVLTLFFEGKNMEEIALITGYTEAYVRKKKFESKKKLIAMIYQDKVFSELNSAKDYRETSVLKRKAI